MAKSKSRTESDFQKWFIRTLLPRVFPGSKAVVVNASGRLGVSDLIVMTKGHGVIAIELKYREHAPKRSSSAMLSHKLSGPQRGFLRDWHDACAQSFVIFGVGWGDGSEFMIFNAEVLEETDLNDLAFGERGHHSAGFDDVTGMQEYSISQDCVDEIGDILKGVQYE